MKTIRYQLKFIKSFIYNFIEVCRHPECKKTTTITLRTQNLKHFYANKAKIPYVIAGLTIYVHWPSFYVTLTCQITSFDFKSLWFVINCK